MQVTLERRYQDKSERLGSYAESEAELKKLYALKGMNEEEIKRQQKDWYTAKKKESRIVVLADPGMGKSTLLRMEVIEIVKISKQLLAERKAVKEVTIPLFIRLSTLADEVPKGLTIKEAILTIIQRRYDSIFLQSDHNETQEFLKIFLTEQLETEKCLLLLDALDEVPQEKRPQLLEKLNEFVSNYPNCRIIGTSRIVGYIGSLVNGAKEMEIVPFIQLQTEQYIKVWFINAQKFIKDKSANAEGLIKALRELPQIAGLAQNPLLLSLICSLYQQDQLTLPARRGQIYERSVKYMLSDWSVDNNRLSVDETEVESKKELLGELAYYFSEQGTEVFTLRDLKQKIKDHLKRNNETNLDQKTNEWINQLCNQDGILQKLNPNLDQYLFLHRTFQEYFTALHLKYQIEDNEREEVDLIKPYFWDYDWHETLSLLAGLLEKPMRLIEVIMAEKDDIFQTQLLLAGNCLAECDSISNSLSSKILQEIRQLLQQYPEAKFIKFVAIRPIQF